MDEEFKSDLVKLIGFGEGERLAHKACKALAQGVVPAFHMRGVAALLADYLMVCAQRAVDGGVGLPEVTKGRVVAISNRNPGPQAPATLLTAVADEGGHHLARVQTECYPDPAFVFLPTKDHSSSSSSTSAGVASATGGLLGNAPRTGTQWNNSSITLENNTRIPA